MRIVLSPSRRRLLQCSAGAGLLGLAATALPGPLRAAASTRVDWRTLVMIKFDGGNDGVNTVIPYTDPLYYKYRPRLGLAAGAMTQISGTYALNKALAALSRGHGTAWPAGDMAIALGVGFPDMLGQGSHFAASDIWGTAVPTINGPGDGWITRLLNHLSTAERPNQAVADAAVVGSFPLEAVAGSGIRTVVTGSGLGAVQGNPESPQISARMLANPVYAWMVQQQAFVDRTGSKLAAIADVKLHTRFPDTLLGGQLAYAAQLIIAKTGIPVISLSHGTFDTHVAQRSRQDTLLEDFADSVAAFRKEMILRGEWSNVLMMTHAEFGRSVFENSIEGTDHGKANAHFILGGAVRGGFYGSQPALSTVNPNALDLHGLEFTLDFRRIYASIMLDWWGIPQATSDTILSDLGPPKSYASLGFVR